MIVLQVALTSALVCYLILGVFLGVFSLWVGMNPALLRAAGNDFSFVSWRGRPKPALWAQILTLPAIALAWPVIARLGWSVSGLKTKRQQTATSALRPPHGLLSIALLALVALTAFLHYGQLAWHPVLITTMWLVLVAVVCKDFSYLVSPLPDRLRQTSRPPWLSFFVVAAADALALTFSVATLRASWEGGHVNTDLVTSSFVALFDVPGNIGDLFALSPGELLVAILGFLYSTAFVKALLTPAQFKRTDDDYRLLASASVMAGHTEDGLRWMRQEKDRNAQSYEILCQIALAKGQWDRAAELAGRLLVAKEEPDTKDSRIANMVRIAVVAPMTDEQAVAFCRYIITTASDLAASSLLWTVSSDYPATRAVVLQSVDEESNPLTLAMAMQWQGRYREAAEVLTRTTTSSDEGEVLRLLRLCILHIGRSDETISESDAFVREWWRSSFPILKDLAGRLELSERYARTAAWSTCLQLDFSLEVRDSDEFLGLRQEIQALADALTEQPDSAQNYRRMLRQAKKYAPT
ncbi:tetratricopeptide repeat protein [Mycetocola miduiensis]|uniref:Uncharacterized protein n=1 Tax=Mycetocola miduiensis TaxID=995034 RepID=A0A1I4ZN81_9MICO|nr:hypothetical protein [Mycetocola miduiensis]SFN51493.1 hypothetical protein SAMN05216219_0930 [Mycetocola miduiensis]